MTDPLRIDRPRATSRGEDLGDVLASIRRLIAQDVKVADGVQPAEAPSSRPFGGALDGTPTQDRPAIDSATVEHLRPLRLEAGAAADHVGVVPLHPAVPATDAADAKPTGAAHLELDAPAPTATMPGAGDAAELLEQVTPQPPLSPARTAELTASLAEAVEAAAARMAETARRVEEARSHQAEPPFRLRADALIPAAPLSHEGEPHGRLSSRLSIIERIAEPAAHSQMSDEAADAPVDVGAADAVGLAVAVAPEPLFRPAADFAGGAQTGETLVVPDSGLSTDTMGVRPESTCLPAAHEHARLANADLRDGAPTQTTGGFGPMAQPAQPTDAADHPAVPAAATNFPAKIASPAVAPALFREQNDETAPTLTEQTMNAQPLRDLLRDAIRDELRGEIGRQLDTDLRRVVREELAAALTEALTPAA